MQWASININHSLQPGRHASDRIPCSLHRCFQCLQVARPPPTLSLNASIRLRLGECTSNGAHPISFNSVFFEIPPVA